jgi:hypothetical protein
LLLARAANDQRVIRPQEPMKEWGFIRIFRGILTSAGYIGVSASAHQIRRELGKQIDGKPPLYILISRF